MNLNEILKGDIKKHCFACLCIKPDMFNLTEFADKLQLLQNIFNIEVNNFKEHPNFLCSSCDEQLNITNSLFLNVKKTLILLKEYNDKRYSADSDEELVNENCKSNLSNIKTETIEENGESRYTNSCNVKICSRDEVEQAIEAFRSNFATNKTCIICGFIAANRRSLSSHMAIFHKETKDSWCLECNAILENYEEHKKSHSGRCDCPFCDKKITKPHYIEHLQSHLGIFECKECKKNFKSAAWLKKHMRIHTNEKPYVCPNCSRGFIQLSSLRYHLRTHGNYACDSCKRHYRTESELKNHECTSNPKVLVTKEIWINSEGDSKEFDPAETIIIKSVESAGYSDLQNFCKECNKRVKSLSRHIEKFHTLVKPEKKAVKENQCEFCEKRFSTVYKLRIHTRSHTGQLPYKCKYCDRRTLTRSRLKDHERTHTKEKPYMCNICGKGLSQSSSLRTHMRQHTGRPETCNLCGKTFCRKSELRLHLSKHMGEKPFLCTICGRTFAQRSHLSEHMACHSEDRPFGCSFCEKRFKTNNLLKEHIKLHQGYKAFKCPTCPYACYKAYRLQQHMKQHNDSFGNNDLLESFTENPNTVQEFDNVDPVNTCNNPGIQMIT